MTRHYTPRPDLTARQAAVSAGIAPRLMWLCGHLGQRKGADIRGGVLYRCARCVCAEGRRG